MARTITLVCLMLLAAFSAHADTGWGSRTEAGEWAFARGDFEAAESLVLESYEGLKQQTYQLPEHEKRRVADAAERVVKLYEAWNKPDKAAEWKKIRSERVNQGDKTEAEDTKDQAP